MPPLSLSLVSILMWILFGVCLGFGWAVGTKIASKLL